MKFAPRFRGSWNPGTRKQNGAGKVERDPQREPVQMVSNSISNLAIEFGNADGFYAEGEELSGSVLVELRESIVIERLVIEFNGTAIVNWGKKGQSGQHHWGSPGVTTPHPRLHSPTTTPSSATTRGQHESEEENYFNQTLCLYNRASQEGSGDLMVSAGSHTYPFSVVVPWQLPSSFTGDYGGVVYTATATLERPWQPNETVSREFHITSVLDLNTLPTHILQPLETHKTQPHGMLCMCSGDITATLRLDRLAYVPGEIIRLNGEVENNTGMKIKKTKAVLIQNVRYYDGWGHSLSERKQVALVEKGEIAPGSVDFWREQMEVPPLPPTGQKCCNVMDLWYTLKLKVATMGSSEAMEASFDMVIGTVPLEDPDDLQYSMSAFSDFYAGGMLDGTSSGSASPITGADNIALDISYFV